MEGSLRGLATRAVPPMDILRQMLQALDYVHHEGYVHGDVKPDNILFRTLPMENTYHFELADFGLCSRTSCDARWGTRQYKSPEAALVGKQTSKADIWSLLVTILWCKDFENFRQREADLQTADVIDIVSRFKENSELAEMAIIDPDQRASAAQMLANLFQGKGLTTPVVLLSNPPASGSPGSRSRGRSNPASLPRHRSLQQSGRSETGQETGHSEPSSPAFLRRQSLRPRHERSKTEQSEPSSPLKDQQKGESESTVLALPHRSLRPRRGQLRRSETGQTDQSSMASYPRRRAGTFARDCRN